MAYLSFFFWLNLIGTGGIASAETKSQRNTRKLHEEVTNSTREWESRGTKSLWWVQGAKPLAEVYLMKEKPYILVVDDDPNIAKLEQLYLEKAGYEVKTVGRGDDAMTEFRKMPPDLMLLDVMMPGMDGWQVLKAVRKSSNIPIIMVTARDETFDKVLGLELGADDYITKPFDSKEMAARVKAVLRRTMGQTEEEEEKADDTLSFPGLTVSLSRYEVFYEGKKLEMPPKELEVLYFLASHVNQLFTRGQLLDQVWGFQVEVESRTVDVHVKRLRDKLVGCEKYGWRIQTIWGRGYKFEVIK